uniref:Tumor protein p53-inducible protein 13 n=1 Tax=Monopterus albus TaxID=43700 RepID=A0A3Q3K1L0_MONAL|nr:tumor protein p53-inducible protein 13 [Monopterus albus]
MPSQTTSPPLTVTVLALGVFLGRCAVSESPEPGCDSGKLSLDRDLPADAIYWNCPVSAWPEPTQRLPSIDTVYDPAPARQICMDKPISYNHTIPNSGAYRPVMAESGEYLFCPPQRWLNNLHHGVPVLLYHPCAPLQEHLSLSVLARSCLPDYIITSHPQLSKHMPIAAVSWGHTLELATVASLDICGWLETKTTTRKEPGGVSQSRKYNLLLTWPAEQHRQQHPEKHSTKIKESLRRCCEETISSLLNGAMEAELSSSMKKESLKNTKGKGTNRQIRAAIRETQENVKYENKIANTTHASGFLSNNTNTGLVQNLSTLGPSADLPPGNRALSDSPSQSKVHSLNQALTPRTTTLPALGSGASETQKGRLMLQKAAEQPSPKHTNPRNPNPSAGVYALAAAVDIEHNGTSRPRALALSSRDEGSAKQKEKDSSKHNLKENDSQERNLDKDITPDGGMRSNAVIEVKQREVEQKQTHSNNTGFDSVSKSQSESPPQSQHHSNSKLVHYLPNTHDCDGCKAGEHCECSKDTGAETRAAAVKNGLPRTPRSDEAVWAAAALGFLLVLLTLSVLHTRLYRHWRTTPSFYWHDPRQDYDSVADVIRRRLRIAKKRRKRGRRQECVLLPSSSSSDECL